MICNIMGHTTLYCPEATCLACKAKGHTAAAGHDEKGKVIPEKYPEQPVGAVGVASSVLVVAGSIDGQPGAEVGLDTFCGLPLLVTREAVEARRADWAESTEVLQGIGPEAVKPLGELDVTVQVGPTVFQETASICETLPGEVDVLVGCGPLRREGLTLSEGGVVLGGHQVLVPSEAAKAVRPKSSRAERRAMAAAEAVRAEERVQRRVRHLATEEVSRLGLKDRFRVTDVEADGNGGLRGYWLEEKVPVAPKPLPTAAPVSPSRAGTEKEPDPWAGWPDEEPVEDEEALLDLAVLEAEADRAARDAELVKKACVAVAATETWSTSEASAVVAVLGGNGGRARGCGRAHGEGGAADRAVPSRRSVGIEGCG